MLNSTKTWQEEFEQEYWGKFGSTKTINDIKQFISDLRKRDMEALIGMLPNREDFANGESQAMACGRLLIKIEQLIKNYYEN